MGRFVLSPFHRSTACGRFAAALSVRSGRGSSTHDRVFGFAPLFDTPQAATRYALDQGRDFVHRNALPA